MMDWISVKDRLPESGNEVLLYGDEEIAIGHFKVGSFWYYSHYGLTNIDNGIISHWMPLPEPPKS